MASGAMCSPTRDFFRTGCRGLGRKSPVQRCPRFSLYSRSAGNPIRWQRRLLDRRAKESADRTNQQCGDTLPTTDHRRCNLQWRSHSSVRQIRSRATLRSMEFGAQRRTYDRSRLPAKRRSLHLRVARRLQARAKGSPHSGVAAQPFDSSQSSDVGRRILGHLHRVMERRDTAQRGGHAALRASIIARCELHLADHLPRGVCDLTPSHRSARWNELLSSARVYGGGLRRLFSGARELFSFSRPRRRSFAPRSFRPALFC